jgi:hypothetical protein
MAVMLDGSCPAWPGLTAAGVPSMASCSTADAGDFFMALFFPFLDGLVGFGDYNISLLGNTLYAPFEQGGVETSIRVFEKIYNIGYCTVNIFCAQTLGGGAVKWVIVRVFAILGNRLKILVRRIIFWFLLLRLFRRLRRRAGLGDFDSPLLRYGQYTRSE